MTSWQRYQAYARQRGQNPNGQVTFTSRQTRRYVKKWNREHFVTAAEDRARYVASRKPVKVPVDLENQGVPHKKLKWMQTVSVKVAVL